ncbi:F0F1 ATP synthase subunit gamma [Candidatus Roizmanbacteria bacterium]|nr:F0F1 ATP synthase subunit gamma [Candidatus Roizmanbacteria bacterium]
MQYKKLIRTELDFTQTFKMIAQAYQEIAVMKMRKIRGSVLSTRNYLSKLSEVFVDAKSAYKRELEERKKKAGKHPERLKKRPKQPKKTAANPFQIPTITPLPGTQLVKKPQPVLVLLTANTKLYGAIVNKVFSAFVKHLEKDTASDIIIIGRLGRRLYQESRLQKPYLYFEIPDTNVTIEHLKPVMFHLLTYEKIYVYYGKFQTIATQDPTISNVSGDQPFSQELETPQVSPGGLFLFEPTLEEIIKFFEGLVSVSLFKQTVYESELARMASRIMAMEEAQDNINLTIQKLRSEEKKVKRLEENKKQLERLSGMSLWGTT